MSKLHPAPIVRSLEYRFPPILETAADQVVEQILRQVAVPQEVLSEANRRRDLVLRIARGHEASNRTYVSGSIAHGTQNTPLGDADSGVVIDRRPHIFRAFGPDAGPGASGPEGFYQTFASFISRASGTPGTRLSPWTSRATEPSSSSSTSPLSSKTASRSIRT
jgi:hypothetical protein